MKKTDKNQLFLCVGNLLLVGSAWMYSTAGLRPLWAALSFFWIIRLARVVYKRVKAGKQDDTNL